MSKGTAPEAGAVAAGSDASRRGVMGSRSDSIWRGVGPGQPLSARRHPSACCQVGCSRQSANNFNKCPTSSSRSWQPFYDLKDIKAEQGIP
jgi:hypothetical protein